MTKRKQSRIDQVMSRNKSLKRKSKGGDLQGVRLLICRALKAAIKRKRCTVQQAATAADITRSLLHHWVADRPTSAPGYENLYVFAEAFGIEARDLMPTMQEWRKQKEREGRE